MVVVCAPYERFFFNPRKVGSVSSAYERLLSAFGSPMSDVPIEISKNIERKALIPLPNLLYKMLKNFKMLKISHQTHDKFLIAILPHLSAYEFKFQCFLKFQ